MQQEAFLLAIAQIAVTLAGFSGLVVAIRGAPTSRWHVRDSWSLAWMLGASFGALFLALSPFVLNAFGLGDEFLWKVATFIMSAAMIGFAIVMALSSRRLTGGGNRARVRYFPTVATCLVAGVGIAVGFSAIGVLQPLHLALFDIGLVTCLLVSALSLVVFLVVLSRSNRSDS